MTWNAVRSSGYGPQPGTPAQSLDGIHDLSTLLNWHGRYVDGTGYYYLGNRYYDPTSGTFLSCDPLGHAASMDLYSYCGGDPVNYCDPDGRLQSGYNSGTSLTMAGDAPNSAAFNIGRVVGAFHEGGSEWGYEFDQDVGNDVIAIVRSPWDSGQNIGDTINNGVFFQTMGHGAWRIGAAAYNIYEDPSITLTNGSAAYQNLSTPQGGADAVTFLASAYLPGKVVGFAKPLANARVFAQAREFFANTTGRTYKVFQRSDINWSQVRTAGDTRALGMTNAQAAEQYGLSPQLPDGNFATLHHSQQNADGPLFEASTRYHNIQSINKAPLHPYGSGGNPSSPMGNGPGSRRQQFQNLEVQEYWRSRAITR